MCRFFETIRITDGAPQFLSYHETRINRTRKKFWSAIPVLSLQPVLKIPSSFLKGVVRCKLIYSKEIESISYSIYERKKIRSLMLVSCDTVDYQFKYSVRSQLDDLIKLKEDCDEIIIIKNGLLTDSSMANLIFFSGKTWYTPKTPLLHGTCRERLIDKGYIVTKKILSEDLKDFVGVKLINAMRYPEDTEIIPVSQIRKKTTFAGKKR